VEGPEALRIVSFGRDYNGKKGPLVDRLAQCLVLVREGGARRANPCFKIKFHIKKHQNDAQLHTFPEILSRTHRLVAGEGGID
jgi:hypothetical protein